MAAHRPSPRRLKAQPWALGALLVTSSALAAPPSPPPAAPGEADQHGLALSVEANGPSLPWTLRLEHRGSAPVQVVADPRLLWFEVRVPGKKQVHQCRLPPELRPSEPKASQWLTLSPGEALEGRFDPRLYCFATGGQVVLVPGAQVQAYLGWPEERRRRWRRGKGEALPERAPFVAKAAAEPQSPPLKRLVAASFALDSRYARWSATALPSEETARSPLELRVTAGSDVAQERSASVSVTVRNVSKEKRLLFVRRDLLRFEVSGPEGSFSCTPEPGAFHPSAQSFSTLAPQGSLSLSTRLRELCPPHSFDRAGLYLVHARLVASSDGAEWGYEAFVGELSSEVPGVVRIRQGELGLVPPRLERVTPPSTSEPTPAGGQRPRD